MIWWFTEPANKEFGALSSSPQLQMISMQPEVIEFLKYVSDATDLKQLRQELFGNKRFSKVLEACSDTSHVSILSEVVYQ